MILPAKRRAATVAIKRFGQSCVISEPNEGVTDGYGKVETDSWSPAGSEHVVRVYGSGATDPTVDRYTGGRLPADAPLLLLRYDTVAKVGFRVTVGSDTYELDSFARYPSHIEARTTLIT